MRDPFARDVEFRRLLKGEPEVDLARVALEIARDAYPELDPDAEIARIDALADRVRQRCPAGARAEQAIGQVNWVLYVEEGFRGNADDYYDPQNSYLNKVLDRKLGLPITLSILYARVAAQVGLELGGVNLPMHYLLRAVEADPPLYVDPFHGGAILDRAGCERRVSELAGREVRLAYEQLVPCNPSTTVSRMLRNLKTVHLERRDFAAALPFARRMAALNRHDMAEQRDWGMVGFQAGRPGESLAPLQRYLDAAPHATDLEAVRTVLKAARRDVASRN